MKCKVCNQEMQEVANTIGAMRYPTGEYQCTNKDCSELYVKKREGKDESK